MYKNLWYFTEMNSHLFFGTFVKQDVKIRELIKTTHTKNSYLNAFNYSFFNANILSNGTTDL